MKIKIEVMRERVRGDRQTEREIERDREGEIERGQEREREYSREVETDRHSRRQVLLYIDAFFMAPTTRCIPLFS
jgi:hypothetical protein